MKTKKILSVILSAVMLFTMFGMAYAADALPESAHDYENDLNQRWDYTYPGDVKGLFVTFSEDTSVEEYSGFIYFDDVVKSVSGGISGNILPVPYKTGDVIVIYGENDSYVGTYRGTSLAGKTVFVPGNTVSIVLITDSSVTDYGFKVTSIEPCPDDYIRDIEFDPCNGGEAFTETYLGDDTIWFDDYTFEKDGFAFVGWSDKEGGAVLFGVEDDAKAADVPSKLYGVWAPVLLGAEEVFDFVNATRYFNVDGTGHYYLTSDDYFTMQKNLFKNFGIGPYPTPIVAAVLATYTDWNFAGSCYGMSVVTALQHYGLLDVLSMQDAECMNDMEPDEELISLLNYYQSQIATSFPAENKAFIKGTPMMGQQFNDMYKTVSDGNIVMLTYFGENITELAEGHVLLLTGCYTKANGDRVFIVYDCNNSWSYEYGYFEDFIVVPAGENKCLYDGEEVGGFLWTSDFSRFESFNINGEGSPLNWYTSFFRHLVEVMRSFFNMILNIFKK